MKKYLSTIAIIIVIAGHFTVRILMQDAFTFYAADYRSSTQMEMLQPANGGEDVLTQYHTSASVNFRNTFNILPADAFSAQWNP